MKYGTEQLPNGYKFEWFIIESQKELQGYVLREDGSMVKGSAGWYRTMDPKVAVTFVSDFVGK